MPFQGHREPPKVDPRLNCIQLAGGRASCPIPLLAFACQEWKPLWDSEQGASCPLRFDFVPGSASGTSQRPGHRIFSAEARYQVIFLPLLAGLSSGPVRRTDIDLPESRYKIQQRDGHTLACEYQGETRLESLHTSRP